VAAIAVWVAAADRRQQPLASHQPQHPVLADAHPALPQPRCHLAMPFA
jgi:hypothetical protein